MMQRMLQIVLVLMAIAQAAGAADPPAGSAESASAGPARKVLVVARIKEPDKARRMEEEAQIDLKDRGVATTLGTDVMAEADFATSESVKSKVESLDVDGVLAFVVLGVDQSVKASPSFSVGIGVGVPMGGGGMMIGASAPIGGGGGTVVRKVRLSARFYNRPYGPPVWEKTYNEKLSDDPTYLMKVITSESVKALKKKKLIAAK